LSERIRFFFYKGRKVEVGSVIKVLPSAPHKRDGHDTKILFILGDNGKVTGVGIKDPRNGGVRTVKPERVRPYLKETKRIRAIRDAPKRS
jgi:hypothetical protein